MSTLQKNNPTLGLELEEFLKQQGQNTPLMASSMSDDQKIKKIASHFKEIMETLGLDLSDDSLHDSPNRVAKMYVNELFCGLNPAHFAGYADWRLFTVEEGAVFWCRTLPVNVTLTSFLRVVATLSGPEMRLPVTAPG